MRTSKNMARVTRHRRIRMRLNGTKARPRLVVYRSLKNIYAQLVDDEHGVTLVNANDLKPHLKGKKTERAEKVGETLGKKALELKIESIVFDRNGFRYHGRIKALAEGARQAGLKF